MCLGLFPTNVCSEYLRPLMQDLDLSDADCIDIRPLEAATNLTRLVLSGFALPPQHEVTQMLPPWHACPVALWPYEADLKSQLFRQQRCTRYDGGRHCRSSQGLTKGLQALKKLPALSVLILNENDLKATTMRAVGGLTNLTVRSSARAPAHSHVGGRCSSAG